MLKRYTLCYIVNAYGDIFLNLIAALMAALA